MKTLTLLAALLATTPSDPPVDDGSGDRRAPLPTTITTSYILGGIVHPLTRDGVPDHDRCTTDEVAPEECRLLQGDGREIVAGGGGWLMHPAGANNLYELPESQLAFRRTRTAIGKDGSRLEPFSNTEVCNEGLKPDLSGCATADGVFPHVRLHRQSLDTRIVSFDAKKRELSWPTRIGPFVLHLGQESAAHVAEAMENRPNVFTVDLIVTMPRKTDRGFESTIVQETRKLTEHWSADEPQGPPPNPLSYVRKREPAAFETPDASSPGPLEGGWKPFGMEPITPTIGFVKGTVTNSLTGCPGCYMLIEKEARYEIVGDRLTITYPGRTRTTSHGDMHPPNTPWNVEEKTAVTPTEHWRILERCPEGPIRDTRMMRHLDSPRCLARID